MSTLTVPKIIIHGGYINESNISTKPFRQAAVQRILASSYEYLLEGHSAMDTAVYAVSQLEDDELFNAGTGSRIQSDGKVRMTASLVDSHTRKFSGVVNIENVKNPIQIAQLLQNEPTDTVLAAECAQQWAANHGIATNYDPIIPVRYEEWKLNEAAKHPKTGTVGAVVLDASGVLCAATSTGGKGSETPGRVSDSGNPAGCFVNKQCGVSITGVGEHAMAVSMASAICTRVKDGCDVKTALARSIDDLHEIGGISGAICLDAQGNFAYDATTSGMVWAFHDGDKIQFFQ